jgi:hypothetical protein
MEREVVILVDGKKLPLLPFVEKLMGDTVSALVGSLKGAEGAREISISVRPRESP